MIVRVSVVLRRTVWGDIDWRFDNLSGSHHHLTLMMTSAQIIKTSVNVTSNSPSQDYTHPDDHNLPNYKTNYIGQGSCLLYECVTLLKRGCNAYEMPKKISRTPAKFFTHHILLICSLASYRNFISIVFVFCSPNLAWVSLQTCVGRRAQRPKSSWRSLFDM